MAARNQEAKEEGDGGYGTNALLDSISGRLFVHDHGSSLDLYSIGLAITERFKRDLDQTPCLWALNTTQKSIFCRNPNYQATTESAFRKWDPRAFIDAIEPVLASHSREPAEMIADVQRLTGGLLDRAKGADDAFQEIEVRTTAVISLLDYCGTWTVIDKYVLDEIQTVCDLTSAAISAAAKAIEDYQYALITRKGGMSELYVLPIRISKLIGWTGALYHFYALLSQRDRFPSAVFLNLLNALIENYPLSISLMCDNQAPYLALGLTAAHQLGFREQGETLLSCLLNSAVGVRGQIADAHIPNGEILRYLLARLEGNFGEALSLVAKPSESLAVLLRAAPLFGLTDEFDHALEELDHVNLNAYFAHDYQRFAQQYIEGGENATFTIGHGIWTVGDLHAVWPFDLALPPPNSAVACGAIAASLIFPDRVPWFVFPNKEDYPAELVKSADDDVDSPTP
jgi:hypothetical protein